MRILSTSAISDDDAEFIPPLQLLSCLHNNPAGDHNQHHSPSNRELAVIPPAVASSVSSYSSRFKVPAGKGWTVKKVLRRDGRTDKYYVEVETGMKFRSSKEVERYIKGEQYPSKSSSKSMATDPRYSKCIMHGGKAIRLDEEEEYNQKQLQHVGVRISINDLPDGWIIEEVPRRLGGSDRYYYEPGTGKKFRSLVAVARHLEEEEDVPLSHCIEDINENAPLSEAFKGKNVSRKRSLTTSCEGDGKISNNDLPDGWVIEEVPRRSGGFDRYYYEPGTGRKFRSLVAVARHLEKEEDVPLSDCIEDENTPLFKAFKGKKVSRNRSLTASSEGNGQTSSSVSPPSTKKIQWVLGSSEGDVWSPFIRGILVPDSVKHQWNRSFMAVMKNDDDGGN